MKTKILIPFVLVSVLWSAYNGLRNGENDGSIIFFVLGSVVAIVGIPLGIAMLTTRKGNVDYEKKRLNTFVVIWAILLLFQVVVAFGEL
jgi:hypothetical protein